MLVVEQNAGPRARHRAARVRPRSRAHRGERTGRRARHQRRRPPRLLGDLGDSTDDAVPLPGHERHRPGCGLRVARARAGPHLSHDRHPQLRAGRDGAVLHLRHVVVHDEGPAGLVRDPRHHRAVVPRWCRGRARRHAAGRAIVAARDRHRHHRAVPRVQLAAARSSSAPKPRPCRARTRTRTGTSVAW